MQILTLIRLITTKLKISIRRHSRKVIRYTTKYGWIQLNSLKHYNIQSVGVTDKYDSANLTVNGADIKAYDSVTGEDVTAKFDIKVENGDYCNI